MSSPIAGFWFLATALVPVLGCVGAALADGAKDCGLSVAGRCGLLPQPVMNETKTTMLAAGMQNRCIDLVFPWASRLSDPHAQSKTDTRASKRIYRPDGRLW